MKRAATVVLMTLAATLTAVPAQAAPSPAVTVLAGGCGGYLYPDTTGSAPAADGRLHGFVGYRHSDCDGRIFYFEGAGSSWRSSPTSLTGTVIDVAQDDTGTYLLYAITELSGTAELAVAKRASNGTITRLAVVAPLPAGWGYGKGSIIARNGRWLAVWPQANGTSGDYDLYQYGTLYPSGGTVARVAVGSGVDTSPTLTFAPDGAVVLAFTRATGTGRTVRLARTTNGTAWSGRTVGSDLPINTDFPELDVAVTTAGTFVAWTEMTNQISQVVVADDLTGGWRRQQPPAVYDSANWDANIVASGSRVLAGYDSGDEYPTDTVLFARRISATGAWTEVPTGGGVPGSIDSKGVLGLSRTGGSVTALVFSGDTLYALNGLSL
ncbi:MAG TPA: hypothetical protein VF755_16710 [Catenuloplanes sp.]